MFIALDTNIFVNIFNGQEKADECYSVIADVLKSGNHCGISASAVTDIFYIVRKKLGTSEAKIAISAMIGMTKVFDVNEKDVRLALESSMTDFEDAVFAEAAKRNKADLIITYNISDFKNAPIKALTPKDFLTARKKELDDAKR